MRILIISNSEWDDNNSFGNTFSNFFDGIDGIEFANIYCREGIPNTKLCNRFLKISDKGLISHLLCKKKSPIHIVENKELDYNEVTTTNKGFLEFVRRKRWPIFFIARELLWQISDYKTLEFKKFIEEFSPDLVFIPIYPYIYINKMALWISDMYHLPMVSYMSDDEYSYRRLSISPLFWFRRIMQRKWVIKVLDRSEIAYVISEIQKQECMKDLGINCKILTKSYDFSKYEKKDIGKKNENIYLLYAGNLGNGRWKTLGYISEAVDFLFKEGFKVRLDIYSSTIITEKMRVVLQRRSSCFVHNAVPYDKLKKIQKDADIVIHVESLNVWEALDVRQSFSTKLVDLFFEKKCIFAVGRKDEASIYHLMIHDAAMVANEKKDIYLKLKLLLSDIKIRLDYADKAYNCGKKYHNRGKMQSMLKEDLKIVIEKKGSKNI
nr:hypothetical protein [uncultured Schaedlerella sp.]